MPEQRHVYLAGPQVFTPYGREFVQEQIIPLLEELSYTPLFPFELSDGEQLAEMTGQNPSAEQTEAYLNWSEKTGKSNIKAIEQADIVLANLDGADVDSGTASEIAYAAGRGTPVIGYRTDGRESGENPAVVVNLQVEQFIKKSGGSIIAPRHLCPDNSDPRKKLYEHTQELLQLIKNELEQV